MVPKNIAGLGIAMGIALGLSACTDGYGGVAVGYNGAYDDRYGGDGYYDSGYAGYGASYFGWYGDYYYPGTGVYVYDSYRRPYRWNTAQQRYWNGRQQYRGRDGNGQGSWNGFYRRDGDERRNDGRGGYTPGARPYRSAPGARTYTGTPDAQPYGAVPGLQANRRNPGVQGARGNPGAQGYRGNRGVQSGLPQPAAQTYRSDPAAQTDGSYRANPTGVAPQSRGEWRGGGQRGQRGDRGGGARR